LFVGRQKGHPAVKSTAPTNITNLLLDARLTTNLEHLWKNRPVKQVKNNENIKIFIEMQPSTLK